MTTLARELEKVGGLPARRYKFRPKLVAQRDAEGNRGLNAVLSYQYKLGGTWRERAIRSVMIEPYSLGRTIVAPSRAGVELCQSHSH